MKIAITGSSSLLGQHIYQLLFLRNYNLKLIDKNIWNITDIATFDIFDNIFDKCQIIIHCAAVTDNLPNDPSGSAFEINITSTSFLAQWCYKKKLS